VVRSASYAPRKSNMDVPDCSYTAQFRRIHLATGLLTTRSFWESPVGPAEFRSAAALLAILAYDRFCVCHAAERDLSRGRDPRPSPIFPGRGNYLAEAVTPGSWKKRQSNPPEIHPHTNPTQMNASGRNAKKPPGRNGAWPTLPPGIEQNLREPCRSRHS
jgi:hypothetical protein